MLLNDTQSSFDKSPDLIQMDANSHSIMNNTKQTSFRDSDFIVLKEPKKGNRRNLNYRTQFTRSKPKKSQDIESNFYRYNLLLNKVIS